MATFGEIRLRIKQLVPPLSLDEIDGFIGDRYTQILDAIPWTRRDAQTTIQTVAPYLTGTVTLTAASAAVTGSGTTWTAGMSGRRFTIPGRNETYTFTYLSATTGTLDRAYEGTTAAGSGYQILQAVYALPADYRLPRAVRNAQLGPMERIDRQDANAAIGVQTGAPQWHRLTYDNTSDPPRAQIELFPAPDSVTSVVVEYTADETLFTSSTSRTLLPWLRPSCLTDGVLADAWLHLDKLPKAAMYQTRFENGISQMVMTDAMQRGPQAIRISDRFRLDRSDTLTDLRRRLMP